MFKYLLTLERLVMPKFHHRLMKYQFIPKVLNLFIPILLTFLIQLITFISPNSKFKAPPENTFYALPPPRAGDEILTSLTLLHESNCTYAFQYVAAWKVRPLETFLIFLIDFYFTKFQFCCTTKIHILFITTSKGRWCHYDITYIIT